MDALTGQGLDAFRRAIGDIAVADDGPTLKLKSRDFFWFSPILKPLLENKRADLIVSPRTKAEVIRVAAAAATSKPINA